MVNFDAVVFCQWCNHFLLGRDTQVFCTVTEFCPKPNWCHRSKLLKVYHCLFVFSLKLLLSGLRHLFIQQVYFAKNVPFYIYLYI